MIDPEKGWPWVISGYCDDCMYYTGDGCIIPGGLGLYDVDSDGSCMGWRPAKKEENDG